MRTFDNPVLGDTIEVLDEGDPDAGRPIRARIRLAPRAQGPPLHRHPRLHERYEVVEGTGSLRVGRERHDLGPGQAVEVPPQTVHRFWNPTDEPVVIAAQVRPASPGFLDFLDALYTLAREGKTDGAGRPSPLQAAVIFHAYRNEVTLAAPPTAIQRVLLPPLAALGRARGYRA